MSGWNWRVAALSCAIAWGWLAGCGPKPMDLWVEPPQPRIAAHSMVSEEAEKPMAGRDRDTSADEPYLIHKVRWGHETLYSISNWYTGKAYNWQRLAEANPKIKPRQMRIGDAIRIPGALLVRRSPMPETYLNLPATRKPKKPSGPIQAPPLYGPVEQAPPLYGPVGEDAPSPIEKRDELPVPLETLEE